MTEQKWTTHVEAETYFACLVDRHGHVLRMHPIGFSSAREAERAVSRLNSRERSLRS